MAQAAFRLFVSAPVFLKKLVLKGPNDAGLSPVK
jgi:hypothetical protein